ncbi:hypothetical protein CWO91_39270 [Bradyrhizobium genosp. SA-3]|uniref:hypothetical protein n=1 Tax=Bradyrhizobium genosp. SA-3 TaxID=508868 RepID=UPI00102A2909|nr:hypothetical protein [Bradyrhizobium genosp. SA-3]RZM94510.1 hypothetical protein CWO91_39270 [Bradyrhizobium genosp. SA-3]
MASIRQIEANRRNAKRSTGPKTAGGKARSSQNALRHGLARSGDPAVTENFAVAIALGFGHQVAPDLTMALARSKLALLRLRSLRQQMLAALLAGPLPADLKRLKGLERYERAALVQQRRALRLLSKQG